MRGIFVTGTDTGVGKTVASCALVTALRRRDLSVGVMKPIETGVGEAGPLDAVALRDASDGRDPLELICPQRFALPAAPNVAARAEGRSVDLDAVADAYRRICTGRDFVVVEGAGGLLVPTKEDRTMADLAADLDLPVVVVARASLGTINHTRLTLEAAERRGLALAGCIISHSTGILSAADAANLEDLRERVGSRLIGEIPPLRSGEAADPDRLRVEMMLD